MKQVVCEQPDHFSLHVSAPIPERNTGEALVRVHHIGVCGTDLHAYKGRQPYFAYPRVLGHELSGVIEEVCDDSAFQSGDRVTVMPYLYCDNCSACKRGRVNCCESLQVMGVHVDGGMQEWITVPERHLIKVPEDIDLAHASLIEPLSIGAHAIRRANLQKEDTVLVIGGGPIGLGVMAFAKEKGAHVIAMDMNERRLQFCQTWAQVDETILAGDNPKEQLLAATGGLLPTTVLDATGNVSSMNQSFSYASHGGQVVFVGLVKDHIHFYHPDVHKKELSLHMSRNATFEDFRNVMSSLENGSIDLSSYITHRAPLEEVPERFDQWLNPESEVIKAVIDVF
ncbi:zinc-binding alcohol dehydrogenase family protein [Bacillaceae bacterium SIJ1]|uniref:zinc-binding alcohol dehydrogenase family protein n=1 Tax=Litoribacterium kuwaitense TaxID=1398745 RepID=UPI0013E9E7F1|nr:zinc-binding alcohol dehydrogenase family protein [Litoribacterium kuwaitense]NGP45068.1 zinc-binding alcohol dehydrogenase family protein [Litoribacterium kuwaitense]